MKRFSAVLLSGFMAASFAVTRAEAQGKPQPQAQGQANAAAAEAAQDPNYVIGPQDVLAINVWKEPELTASVPVRSDGKISMPLLNDVQAAGLTPMQLMTQITAGLKKFVTDPQVTV